VISFSLLCILAMPFLPVWMIAEEFTPLTVEVRDSSIVISHLSEVTRIDVAEIELIELLEDCQVREE
jgi:hypothetical protein